MGSVAEDTVTRVVLARLLTKIKLNESEFNKEKALCLLCDQTNEMWLSEWVCVINHANGCRRYFFEAEICFLNK